MNDVYSGIERHIPDLRGYARAISRSPTDADDLLQESLLSALAKSHQYAAGTNLRAWLFTIVHNKHVSAMRRNRRMGATIDPEDAGAALAVPPGQEMKLVILALEHALSILPDEQRRLIEMTALDGMAYGDIARTRGVPVGTVKSRISRARAQLRQVLDGREGGASAFGRRSVHPQRRAPRGVSQAAVLETR